MGSISIVHWVAVLLVVVLVFGTKKLGTIGTDLGKAVKGFKEGVKGADEPLNTVPNSTSQIADKTTILDIEAKEKVNVHGRL